MKKIFLILLIIFGTVTAHADDYPTLSLQTAVSEALKNKPSIQAFHFAIKDYERQRKTTLSPYLPNISVTDAAYNVKSQSYSEVRTNMENNLNVAVNQTILDISSHDNYKYYSSYVSLTKHQRESHIDQVRIETETAFFNAWILQQKLPLILSQYLSAKAVFQTYEQKYKQSLLDKNEWLKSNSSYASSLVLVNSFRDDIDSARQSIEYYTNLPLFLLPQHNEKVVKATKLSWSPSEKIELKPVDYYYQKSLSFRKDLREKTDIIESERHKSDFYTKQYVPNVSLFGNLTQTSIRKRGTFFSKEGGVQVTWNVFDGLSNYFNKSAADARKAKAMMEKVDLANKIKLDIQTAYSILQKEIKNLGAQTISFNQSKNEFTLKKQQFDAGLISKVDFETAKYSFEVARHNWLTQAATTALKKQELLFNCGYPD